MNLLLAHRILITAAILMFLFYAALLISGRLPGGEGGRWTVAQASLALLAAGGLGAYLGWMWRGGGRRPRP